MGMDSMYSNFLFSGRLYFPNPEEIRIINISLAVAYNTCWRMSGGA
jgi:hypothetical protein